MKVVDGIEVAFDFVVITVDAADTAVEIDAIADVDRCAVVAIVLIAVGANRKKKCRQM